MKFCGPFRDIVKDTSVKIVNLYESLPSRIINFFNYDYSKFELEVYLKYYNLCRGNILELGCGSGRLTLVLAEHGANVIGIDNSESMLELFRKNVSVSIHKEILNERVKVLQQDIFNYDIKDDFNLVILPSTTISILVINYEKLINTMNRIYNDLPFGGFFIFDYLITLNYKEEILSNQVNIDGNEYKNTFCNFIDKENKCIVFNMLTEDLSTGNKYLSYSIKKITTPESIYKLVNQTQFTIVNDTIRM